MEKGKTTLTAGTWDKLDTTETPESAKINFEVNVPRELVFVEDYPQERVSQFQEGVYYKFLVKENGKDAVVNTNAITLIAALKKLSPLKDRKIKIVKKLIKGKQVFEANLIV